MSLSKIVEQCPIVNWIKQNNNKPFAVINLVAHIAALYAIYKTIRIYLKRRKYKHIPGPPTKGFILV